MGATSSGRDGEEVEALSDLDSLHCISSGASSPRKEEQFLIVIGNNWELMSAACLRTPGDSVSVTNVSFKVGEGVKPTS